MQNKSDLLMNTGLSEIKENILATLAYFDMFNYPLSASEIFLFLNQKYDYETFHRVLKGMLMEGSIHQFEKFYTLKNNHYIIVRRIEGNKKAAELMKTARKVGEWLIRFPYVRGVAVSGSLSKNFADEFSDIDLFIITEGKHLWIARTLMHCFKKLTFLIKKEHFFCMNYYIDMQALEIPEKNIYTAIEVATLIPLQGDVTFEQFYEKNAWTRDFLPNKYMRLSLAKALKPSVFKRSFEALLNNAIGNSIDNLLMKITAKRWHKKTQNKKVNSHGNVLALVTGKHYAKPDPKNYQGSLLARYENKVADLINELRAIQEH